MKNRLLLFTALAMILQPFAADAVNVRSGEHERSNRLVFDWPSNVQYRVSQNGNNVSIQFNSKDTAQLKAVLRAKLPYLRNLSQTMTTEGLRINFQMADGAKLESFRLGTKTAFDVVHTSKTPPKFSGNAAVTPAPAPAAPVKAAPVEEKPKADIPDPASLPAPKIQTPPAAEILPPPPQPVEESKEPVNPRLQTLADRLAGINIPQQPSTAPQSPVAGQTAPKEDTVTAGTRITLNPGEFTKLAAFIRSGKLWLVLDKPLPKFMPQIEGEDLASLTKNARRIDQPKATAFVFDAPTEASFSTKRVQSAWQIWINNPDQKYLPDDIPVHVNQEEGDAQLSIYAGEDPSIVQMKDSLTGDRLWIVPVRSPEGRITQLRRAPGYEFLPTIMGAAVILKDDSLQISTTKDMVAIGAKAGRKMLLSDPKDRAKGMAQATFNPVFSLEVKNLKTKGFTKQRQELQKRLVDQKEPKKKALVLLDTARFYLAQGFGQEAVGLLRMAKSLAPDVAEMREYQALRGMASAMTGDMAQVEADLKSDALQSQPAAKLWLGYALAQNNQWQAAKAAFFESGTAENSFPDILKPRLVLAKAETALQTDDVVHADRELKKLMNVKNLRPYERAALDYIKASTAVGAKNKKQVLPIYEELLKGNNQLYRVKADLEVVAHKLATKEITLDKAIEKLERLRFSWRGDRLEIDILQRLGQYYVDNKQFLEGLTIWRQAASLSQNSDDTDAITQNMQDVFKKLYVEGEADKLQPLQAVAIFERFRELTPPGEAGLIALERLADRLASVDLLEESDALLSKQLRLLDAGPEKAKMGSKLASWRLQNDKAEAALQVLDDTIPPDNISDELSQRRLLLRARALADLGRVDEALALLNTSQSEQALSLKADINWRQNRWSEALVALQALVNNARNNGDIAPDGPMPSLIMKMAIALTLDGNAKGMELLQAQYGQFMSQTPRAQAFELITKPSRGSALADLETLKSQMGEVELFQKFLTDFGK